MKSIQNLLFVCSLIVVFSGCEPPSDADLKIIAERKKKAAEEAETAYAKYTCEQVMPFELLQGISKIYWDIEEASSNAFKDKEAEANYPDNYEQFITKFVGTKIKRECTVLRITETEVIFYPPKTYSRLEKMQVLQPNWLNGIYQTSRDWAEVNRYRENKIRFIFDWEEMTKGKNLGLDGSVSLGWFHDNDSVKIGEVIDLETAKNLNKGDLLVIEGELSGVAFPSRQRISYATAHVNLYLINPVIVE